MTLVALDQPRMFFIPTDIFEDAIVGPNAKSPDPADLGKSAWSPFMAWCWMLSEAYCDRINSYPTKVEFSERALAAKANWSRKAVRCFLERLAKHEMVRLSSTARTTIVDFCDYDEEAKA